MIPFLLGCLVSGAVVLLLAGRSELTRGLGTAQSCLRVSAFWILALLLTTPLGGWTWFGLGLSWSGTCLLAGIGFALCSPSEPRVRHDEIDGIGITPSSSVGKLT